MPYNEQVLTALDSLEILTLTLCFVHLNYIKQQIFKCAIKVQERV